MTEQQEFSQTSRNKTPPSQRDPLLALNESQFEPYFQPIIHLRSSELVGFEVLARWKHPTEGLISPNHFIGLAERDGWIGDLMQQIVEKAFVAVVALSDTLTLAINVSPMQLRDSQLPDQLHRISREAGFPLHRLVVEITESALIDDISGAAKIVAELRAMGCKLALDDFGTGYSSLNHLQALPFDELKVDRSFVSSMIEKRESRKIVSAVIGLGQSLHLATVAEGIETQEQAEMMLWLGCELGQGYFFGRPAPTKNLADVVFAQRDKIVAKDLRVSKRILAGNLESSPSQKLAQLEAIYDGAPVGLAFVDQAMRYQNVNKRLADMNRATVESHLGSHVSEMIPHLFVSVEPYIRRALEGEVITDHEATDPNGEEARLYSFQPAYDEAGEIIGVVLATRDITERKQTLEALKRSELHYKKIVNLNPDVLWIMDPQGKNLAVTPRWDKSTGLMKAESHDHKWLKGIHPDDLRPTVRAIAVSRKSSSPIDVQYRIDDGENWKWKQARGNPRFDENGNIVCWYGSVQDVEAPSQASQPKPEPEGRLIESSLNEGEDMTGTLSIRERRNVALSSLEILDTPRESAFDDLVTLASEICDAPISMVSLIDDERVFIKAAIGMDLYESPTNISFCKYTVEQHGILIVEDATNDQRFMSNPFVLGEAHIRFYAGLPLYGEDEIAVGTLCVIDTKPRSLSPGQRKALSILSHQVQARMELQSERRKLLKSLVANRALTKQLEVSNATLSEANCRLEQLATTDALTGLLNRRAFQTKIGQEFTTAEREMRLLALLVLDIDDFKSRNDEYGHSEGDEALRHVGEILRKSIRGIDSAARIGGDEFVVVLPETSGPQAAILAKRIQAVLALGRVGLAPITVSIGSSCLGPNILSWQDLFSDADRAMYKAKRESKTRALIAEKMYVV